MSFGDENIIAGNCVYLVNGCVIGGTDAWIALESKCGLENRCEIIAHNLEVTLGAGDFNNYNKVIAKKDFQLNGKNNFNQNALLHITEKLDVCL